MSRERGLQEHIWLRLARELLGKESAHRLRIYQRVEVQVLMAEGVGRHDARAALFLEQPARGVAGKGFACKVVVTDLVRHEQLLVEGGSTKVVTG